MQHSSTPITASSLAEAKLEATQRRLAFLWGAAHTHGLPQLAPAVSAGFVRSLRQLAFQEDIAVAASHTQNAVCSHCCCVRVAGVNSTVRIEASNIRKKEERKKTKRKEQKKRKRAQRHADAAAAAGEKAHASIEPNDGDPSTPLKKQNRKRAPSALDPTPSKAAGFLSPFAGRAALPASSSAAATASASVTSTLSSHVIVLRCLRCGHADRIAGQNRKQKALLHAASDTVDSLVAQTTEGQTQQAAEVAARESSAKRQKLLQSLQVQQQPASTSQQPMLRPSVLSLEQLAQAQHRLQAAKSATAVGSFFGEQVRDAAVVAMEKPPAADSPPASSAPFSFSKSGPTPSSAKKPSLSSLLSDASVVSPHSVFSSASMFASPNSMQGIRIASGIQSSPAAAASSSSAPKGFTFTKSVAVKKK